MREILFRGKLKSRSKWSYGNLNINKQGISIITPDETPSGIYGQVIPETVGQYTGLKDKNGTRIFEGDILKIVDDEGNTDFSDGGVGNVEFAYGLWYVSGKPQNGLWDLLQAYYCEVIGNIHDNPELLGGE